MSEIVLISSVTRLPPISGIMNRDNPVTLDDLKPFLDKTATLHMTDGEAVKVNGRFVDEEYQDIIADVLETSRPEHYRDPSAAYTFAAADIASVERSD